MLMKKTFLLNLVLILFYYFMIMFFTSCKKEHSDNNPGNDTKTCSPTKTVAEEINIFPSDNPWNTDISTSPVDPYNEQIIAQVANTGFHPDFGSGEWDGAPIGIPYVVVCSSQAKIPVVYRGNNNDGNYGDESDPGPFPIPLTAPIEGNGNGDSHVIAVDIDNKKLYELYNASVNGNNWEASSGAVFNLQTNELRTEGWTSADAAGLPIFPGLVRYDEIEKGVIDHAIRFTLSKNLVKPSYIYPARHKVNGGGGQYGLPFGARVRLKNSFDISSYPARIQIILKAMKKYGIILADIGSNLYISGAPDERWNNDELRLLGNIKGSDLEVVKFNN